MITSADSERATTKAPASTIRTSASRKPGHRTGQGTVQQDRVGQDRAGKDKAGQDRAGQNKSNRAKSQGGVVVARREGAGGGRDVCTG